MKRIINKVVYTVLIAGSVAVSSCTTSDLDPTLAQQKESEEAFKTVNDLEGALKGMYNRMTASTYYGRDYLVTNEVRTPNTWANGKSGRFITEATFQYSPNNGFIWSDAYRVIAVANLIIGTDVASLEGDAEYAKHMQGQAYAVRALAHFDLLKTYGQQHTGGTLGIPYISEFKGDDEIPARGTIQENLTAIFADLQSGFDLMNEQYFDASKVFMSKYTAPALASRVAVYFASINNDPALWAVARDSAKVVIDSQKYSVVPADQFVASFATGGAVNSIFELAFSDTDNLSSNSISYIYRGESYGDVSVTDEAFYNLYESEDDVRTDILGTEIVQDVERLRNMGKYPEFASNIPVIRYEEVVLNYAEALFELGEGDPLTWLNLIPENRNADTYTEVTKANILEERREEFLFEGLYYWDLLRTGMDIVRVQSDQPINVSYGDDRLVYPIPFVELDANSNIEQNPGYSG